MTRQRRRISRARFERVPMFSKNLVQTINITQLQDFEGRLPLPPGTELRLSFSL